MPKNRAADKPKMPAALQNQIDNGGKVTFHYLGQVAAGKTDTHYGLEVVSKDNVNVWRRTKGSWAKGGNAGSVDQAKRSIARREGILND